MHEKSVVGASADDSDFDLVSLVPSCEAVHDVNAVPSVQVVDCSLAVDSPDLQIPCQRNRSETINAMLKHVMVMSE